MFSLELKEVIVATAFGMIKKVVLGELGKVGNFKVMWGFAIQGKEIESY